MCPDLKLQRRRGAIGAPSSPIGNVRLGMLPSIAILIRFHPGIERIPAWNSMGRATHPCGLVKPDGFPRSRVGRMKAAGRLGIDARAYLT
jgi:hypothetical protein